MRILLSLLERIIDLKKYSLEKLSDILTNIGLEVESVEKIKNVDFYKHLIVGEIISCKKHPNADRLNITQVNIGDGKILNIVCGAPNAREGINVVVAQDNTMLTTFAGEHITIKKTKIREEISEGMLCAEDEIGLSNNHEKIIEVDKRYAVGTTIDKVFNIKSDYAFDIELTPNRWYAASHIGLAHDLAAKISFLQNDNINIHDIGTNNIDTLPQLKKTRINISNNDLCSRYCGLLCKNIKIKPSPKDIQEKLQYFGIKPINNIVDITNLVMIITGQPIHAYDFNKINGNINIELSTNDSIEALNGKKYNTTNDIVICDDDKILCLAGIIGGQTSAINDNTTEVFFESAVFNPTYIRKTSQRLNIQTEAAKRFEHGIDPTAQMKAIQYIYDFLQQYENDIIFVGTINTNNTYEKRKINSSFTNINMLIGKEISQDTVIKILNTLDIKTESIDSDKFIATIPSYRTNVKCEADIADEILRIYGYENITAKDHFYYLCQRNDDNTWETKHKIEQQISAVLCSKGFYEIKTNSLVSSKYASYGNIKIINPLSNNFEILRQDMYSSIINVVHHNISHGNKNLKLFEFGKTYKQTSQKTQETQHLFILISGILHDSWHEEKMDVRLLDLKNIISDILVTFDIKNITYKKNQYGNIIIEHDNSQIATINKYVLSQEVFCGDINFDSLLDIIQNKKHAEYKSINYLPVVKRDLSLILDNKIQFCDIEKIIHNLHEKNIINFKLFSTFKKDKDSKIYSVSFYMQNGKKNLDTNAINKIMDKVMNTLTTQLNAIIKQ